LDAAKEFIPAIEITFLEPKTFPENFFDSTIFVGGLQEIFRNVAEIG